MTFSIVSEETFQEGKKMSQNGKSAQHDIINVYFKCYNIFCAVIFNNKPSYIYIALG